MFFVHKICMTLRIMGFHLYRRTQGTCVLIIMMAEKAKQKFQYTLRYAGHNTIFLEEVDPTRFLIFWFHNSWAGKETAVVNLLGRSPTVSWDIMQMFKNYCKHHRISPANIIYLTQMDRCPRARQQVGRWAQELQRTDSSQSTEEPSTAPIPPRSPPSPETVPGVSNK